MSYAHLERLQLLFWVHLLDGKDEPDMLLFSGQKLALLPFLLSGTRVLEESIDRAVTLLDGDMRVDEI